MDTGIKYEDVYNHIITSLDNPRFAAVDRTFFLMNRKIMYGIVEAAVGEVSGCGCVIISCASLFAFGSLAEVALNAKDGTVIDFLKATATKEAGKTIKIPDSDTDKLKMMGEALAMIG
jgi:hypothetical protein